MKVKKRLIQTIAIMIAVSMLLSCSLDIFGQNKVTSITLSGSSASIDIDDDDFITISASATTKGGSTVDADVNWDYDHEVFQEITKTGSSISLELNTDGIGANGRDITGRTVIRATDKSTSASSEFIVNVTGELKSIWFEDPSTGSRLSSIMTDQKETVTLRIGTYPRAAQNFELIGENDPDNPDIAAIVVDSAAKEAIIETQKPGTAHLKVSTTDDKYSSTIQVTVSEMVLPDTTPSKIVINGGDFMEISTRDTTSSLSVSVYDQYNKDITDQSLIEWESSAPGIVSLSSNSGSRVYINPLMTGTSEVVARLSEYPNLYATCTVTVGNSVEDIIITEYERPRMMRMAMMSRSIDLSSEEPQTTSSFPIGKSVSYKATYIPSDTDQTGIEWSLSDESIARITGVNDDIVDITTTAEGNVNLIAQSTANPDVFSYITIGVYDQNKNPDLSIQALKLDPTVLELEEGEEAEIEATALFQDGSEADADISWSTSSSAISIVDSGTGYARIRAESASDDIVYLRATSLGNPSVYNEAAVLVYREGEKPGAVLGAMTASPASLTMLQGSQTTIEISYLPEAAPKGINNPSLSSDSVSIVSYTDSSVTIRAEKPGTSTITISSSKNSSVTTRATVRVLSQEEATQPSRITLDRNTIELDTGGSETVNATVYLVTGETYDGYGLEWAATEGGSNISIKTNGETAQSATITGSKAGDATVKISIPGYDEIYANLAVGVYNPGSSGGGGSSPDLRRIVPNASSLTLIEGDSTTIRLSFLPSSTEQRNFTVSSSEAGIIAITENEYEESFEIYASRKGSTTVTVTSEDDPDISADISVRVISEEESITPSVIKLTSSSLNLELGSKDTVYASLYNAASQEIDDVDFIWEIIQGEDLVRITPSGERCSFKAIKIGTTAVVRVTAQGYPEITADLAVSVITEGADPTVELLRLVPSSRKLTLVEGDEYSLDVAYVPSNTFQTGYSYTTDSNGVISVEKNDEKSLRISAVKATDEPTILTLTSSYNPDISTEVEVLVITEEQATKKLSSVRFFENSLEISPPYPEDEIRINVFSYDSDGNEAEDTYTWRILEGSEHITFREIANESGTAGATVRSPGTVRIRATSNTDTSLHDTITLTISGGLKNISISPSSTQLYLNGQALLRVSFSPEDALDKSVRWETISDDGIQRISYKQDIGDENAIVITGIRAGETKVRATSETNPNIFAEAEITVLDEALDNLPSSIRLDATEIEIDPPFATYVLNATVYGENDVIYPTGVEWSIENGNTMDEDSPTIATLSESGQFSVRIIPQMAGEATITATSIVKPDLKASCSLIINGEIGKIEFVNQEEALIELVENTIRQLEVELKTSDGLETVEKEIEWYEEYQGTAIMPVYGTDGSIAGYDVNGDGKIDDSADEIRHVELTPTFSGSTSGASIKGIQPGTTSVVVRSKVRPEVYAKITVNITAEVPLAGTIAITPDTLELSPDSDKVLITARVSAEDDYFFNSDVDVDISVDDDLLVFSSMMWDQDGETWSCYATPNPLVEPGEGFIRISLPDFPGIREARARVFLGGELKSLSPYNPEGDDDVLIISKGDVTNIGVDYVPANTNQTGLQWHVEDSNILSVTPSSGGTRATITGKNAGNTRLIVTSTVNPAISYSFTVTVKPIVESVSFTTYSDSGTPTTGLRFATTSDKPLKLECNIYPSILDDTQKLILEPSGSVTGSDDDIPTLDLINGTVNDYIFTPVRSVNATYTYDIMQMGNELKNDVIDTLTIIVAADSINPVIEERGIQQERIDRFVFSSETSDEITIKFVDSKGISIYGVEYEILSGDVPKAIGLSEEDGIATVRRNKDGGTTVIRASVNSGLTVETYDITIYTNYTLPESLINALRSAGVIADSSSDMYGIYVKSIFDQVTAIDLSKLSLSYAVEVYNDSEDINYLEYFPNLTSINLSNTRLASPIISLDGNDRLRELRIENDKNTSFQIQDVTDIPAGLQVVDASGNAISEYGLFSKAGNSLKTLDLSNTSIDQFNDRNYIALTNLDISDCTKLTRLTIEHDFNSASSSIDASNSAITKAEISSRMLKSLDLSDNNLTELVISGADSTQGLNTLYVQNNNLGQKDSEFIIGSTTIKRSGSSTCSSFTSWGGVPIRTICASGNNLYATGNKDSNNNFQWKGNSFGSSVSASVTCDPPWNAIWHNDKFGIILYKNNSTLTSSTKNEGHWWSGSASKTLNYSFKSTPSDTLKLNLYFNEGDYSSSSFTVRLFD